MKDNAIITAAITGAVHIPSISEYLPITPQQIIDQAVCAAEAGAAVVHIHGRRKEDGMPVSYTHLDVYKRQFQPWAADCGYIAALE